jgi:hypothetical protein
VFSDRDITPFPVNLASLSPEGDVKAHWLLDAPAHYYEEGFLPFLQQGDQCTGAMCVQGDDAFRQFLQGCRTGRNVSYDPHLYDL